VVTGIEQAAASVELTLDPAKYARVKAQSSLMMKGFRASPTALLDLELERTEVFTPDARIVLGTPNGDVPLPRPDVALFRGHVAGDPASVAFVGFSPHGSNGFILTRGTMFLISSQLRNGAMRTTAFDAATLPPGAVNQAPWDCGTDNVVIPPDRQAWFAREVHSNDGGSTAGEITRTATLAIETDWEFTGSLFGGNTAASGAYAATLIGGVSEIYLAQVSTNIEIGFLRLWSDAADPWTSTSTSNQLNQLRNHWESLMTGVERHAVHMLSGRSLGGGIAYLGGLCSNGFDYAVSANLNGSFPYPLQDNHSQNWDIMVTAHELGHNFGAPHTHSTSPPIDNCAGGNCSVTPNGTIMSYCHQCPGGLGNILLVFHQRIKDEYILPFLNSPLNCNLSSEPIDCGAVEPPTSAPVGSMNRFLAVTGGNPGERTAIRITYGSVPLPNQHLSGSVVWVSTPTLYSEHSASKLPSSAPPGWPTFYSADVSCTPGFFDWSEFGTVYVRGASLVPGSTYAIESVLLGCSTSSAENYSAPLMLATSGYGDIVGDCMASPCSPANGVAEGLDITAILDKFRNAAVAPSKAQSDLDPGNLDGLITIADILRVLDGFRNNLYLYTAPAPCP
jgi:hypothetical protein